ncbi:MAG: hypothetical protein M3419_00325 [Actinomycetota bacterium]|nr:hypothetical protein [Actinomycetota bacterium]
MLEVLDPAWQLGEIGEYVERFPPQHGATANDERCWRDLLAKLPAVPP